jgi:hypothetical protein
MTHESAGVDGNLSSCKAEIETPMGHEVSMKRDDLIYIAGFFDGEGDARITMIASGKNGKKYPTLTARLTQCDRSVLDWIANGFGFGNVYVKQKASSRHKTCHAYQTSSRAARKFLTAIEPHLKIKRAHVTELLNQAGREPLK